MAQSTNSGAGYWATQIGASALFVVLGFGGGIFILASDSEEKGQGVMLLFVGVIFLGLLIWLIRQMTTRSSEQRAVYAWAIMQQHAAEGSAAPDNDVVRMGRAARARDGKLTRDEILSLQALRPDVPYPATLPPALPRPSVGS
jgi:hypothetical protein